MNRKIVVLGALTLVAGLSLFAAGLWFALKIFEPSNFYVLALTCGVAVLIAAAVLFFAMDRAAGHWLRRRYNLDANSGIPVERRMTPHPFSNFVPSNDAFDISDHFRSPPIDDSKNRTIYLVGDCTAFESHLPYEDTLANLLGAALPDTNVLNAAAPYYTILHSYNRLVYDLTRGYQPDTVILFTGANDMKSFVQHRNGQLDPAHTHMYKTWSETAFEAKTRPGQALLTLLHYLFVDREAPDWETLGIKPGPQFWTEPSLAVARDIFTVAPFERVLNLFKSTCDTYEIKLIVTTVYFFHEPNKVATHPTYAWGIERLNQSIRKLASEQGFAVADLADEIDLTAHDDVWNKWHFSRSGNAKRVAFLKNIIEREAAPSKAGA